MHHLTQDMKQLLSEAQVAIPLLSPARHGFCDTESLDPEAEKICGAYREQVKGEYHKKCTMVTGRCWLGRTTGSIPKVPLNNLL